MLNGFMKPIRDTQKIRNVNIYINLDDIFHTLHRPLIDREFQACGKNAARQLVSNVFNIIGHYRNWALKERLKPRIYAYYSSAKFRFRNNMHIAQYRKHYFDIMNPQNATYYFINDATLKAFPIFHVIAKYLEDIYIVDTHHLEPAILPLYLAKEYAASHPTDISTTWNIVVSRDPYDIQYCYRDRWSLISPKGDNSILVNRKNMWEYVAKREGVYREQPPQIRLSEDLYIIARAVVGDRYRNIPRLKSLGWKTLFNYLEDVQSDECTHDIISLQTEKLVELIAKKSIDDAAFNKNLSAINIESQVNGMLETDKAMIQAQLEDMIDYPALAQINNDLFHDFPLNLAFLCNQPTTGRPQW